MTHHCSNMYLLTIVACIATGIYGIEFTFAESGERAGASWFIADVEQAMGTPGNRRVPSASGELQETPQASNGDTGWGGDSGQFFLGAFGAFIGHETGHLIANTAENTHFSLERVEFGPVPFFTIEPNRPQSPREHYITASAGLSAQFLINEWLLTQYPRLKVSGGRAFEKGLATFNYGLGIAYPAVGILGTGTDKRDTKGMADSLGWSEESVSMLVLTPTILDHYRYEHPDCEWARDASRLTKALIVGLALSCDN